MNIFVWGHWSCGEKYTCNALFVVESADAVSVVDVAQPGVVFFTDRASVVVLAEHTSAT